MMLHVLLSCAEVPKGAGSAYSPHKNAPPSRSPVCPITALRARPPLKHRPMHSLRSRAPWEGRIAYAGVQEGVGPAAKLHLESAVTHASSVPEAQDQSH